MGFAGEPFFEAKERFPRTPSKKAVLEIAGRLFIILCASETKVTAIKKSPNKRGKAADAKKPIHFPTPVIPLDMYAIFSLSANFLSDNSVI